MYIFVMGFVNCIVGCWLWFGDLTRLWSWKFEKQSVSLCYLPWHFKAILSETKLLSHSINIHWAWTVYQALCWVLELQYREDRHFADFTVVEGNLRRFIWFFLTKKQCCLVLTKYFCDKSSGSDHIKSFEGNNVKTCDSSRKNSEIMRTGAFWWACIIFSSIGWKICL